MLYDKQRYIARVVVPYGVFAALWIYLSDRALVTLVTDAEWLTSLQTYQGLAFVCVSTYLLYWLVRHEFAQQERAQSEQARLSNRVFGILESMADGFVALDRAWRYQYVNRRAAELLGRPQEQLIGEHIWQEFSEAVGQDFYRAYHRVRSHDLAVQLPRAAGLSRYCRLLVVGMAATFLSMPLAAADQPPLKMGVLPYLSSERLFQAFLPMKDYLEAQLKRRIVLSTAPNFKTYVQRAARGDYDIYQTAPHFALLAETEQGYRRVGRFTRELDGDVIVHRDSPVRRVEDLRGRTVITPDPLAITSMLGEQLLKEHELVRGRDYKLLRTASHNTAILTVHRGGADAALTSAAVFERLSPEARRELRVLSKTRQVPHMMIMSHPRLSAAEHERLQRALLAFRRDGAGRKFFEATGYGDMAPISDADMAQLRPFLTDLKERLK